MITYQFVFYFITVLLTILASHVFKIRNIFKLTSITWYVLFILAIIFFGPGKDFERVILQHTKINYNYIIIVKGIVFGLFISMCQEKKSNDSNYNGPTP